MGPKPHRGVPARTSFADDTDLTAHSLGAPVATQTAFTYGSIRAPADAGIAPGLAFQRARPGRERPLTSTAGGVQFREGTDSADGHHLQAGWGVQRADE